MDTISTAMTAVFLFILGSAMGSFLNVLSDRLPNGETIMGRSHCDYCKHTLEWYDLFPVFSFLVFRGKCHYCKKKLSWYYPVSEILTGVAFVVTWFFTPVQSLVHAQSILHLSPFVLDQVYRGVSIVIISALLVVLFADLKSQIIPDSMQIVLLVAAFVLHLVSGASFMQLAQYLTAGILIMSPILGLFLITKGRGMGFGDVKLALVIGCLLGIKLGLAALYVSFVTGAVVGGLLILFKKKGMKSKMAFGPFLVLGILLMLFFHNEVLMLIKRFWGV